MITAPRLINQGFNTFANMSDQEILQDDQDDVLFEHHRIVADAGQALLRIDKFLMDRLPNVTRTKVQDGIHLLFQLFLQGFQFSLGGLCSRGKRKTENT